MSDNKKIFTIEINGIKQAYDEVCLLSDSIDALEILLTKSKITTLLSAIFGSANNINSVFKTSAIDLEKIISESIKLEAVVKQIDTIHTKVIQIQSTTDATNTTPQTQPATPATSSCRPLGFAIPRILTCGF